MHVYPKRKPQEVTHDQSNHGYRLLANRVRQKKHGTPALIAGTVLLRKVLFCLKFIFVSIIDQVTTMLC